MIIIYCNVNFINCYNFVIALDRYNHLLYNVQYEYNEFMLAKRKYIHPVMEIEIE